MFSFSGGESKCYQSLAAIIDKTTPKLYALTSLRIAVLFLVSVSVQDKQKLYSGSCEFVTSVGESPLGE